MTLRFSYSHIFMYSFNRFLKIVTVSTGPWGQREFIPGSERVSF